MLHRTFGSAAELQEIVGVVESQSCGSSQSNSKEPCRDDRMFADQD